MRKTVSIIAGVAMMACMAAHAFPSKTSPSSLRYKWHDSQGNLHFSDSLTTDAIKNGYDIVNDRGIVVRHIDRTLNAEEKVEAKKQADALAAQQRSAQEQVRSDSQMLSAYPNEDAYRAVLRQELDNIDQQINTTQINLRSQEKALTDLLGRAGDLERAKQPVPKYLTDSIAKQRGVVANQRTTLERQQDNRDSTAKRMELQLRHYRDLKAAQGK